MNTSQEEPSAPRRPRGRPPAGAREALLAGARSLFAERGFEATSTEDIVARSGVSKGAMYHHFPSKLELFEAVYLQIEDAAVAQLVEAAGEGSPVERLRAGSRAYLYASSLDDDFARINLTQARRVLGLDRWRELATERGLGVVAAQLRAAIAQREMAPLDVQAAAEIYLAALIEAGLVVERAEDKAAAQHAGGAVLDRLLDGLAGPPGHG